MRRVFEVATASFAFAFAAACGSSGSDGGGGGQDAHATVQDASIADAVSNPADAAATIDAGDGEHDAGGEAPDAGRGGDSGADPISVPSHTWTWVDFPNSHCDDGSPTGIGVNTSSATSNLLIFFNGGGACWDYQTCYQLNTAAHGPIGQAEFDAERSRLDRGALSRTSTSNIFKDWSYVFIPYCTGDVHAGDNIATYSSAGTTKMYYHKGHANVLEYLPRLAATFPSPGKLVVSGASAGGYGSAFNYKTIRGYWPSAKAYMIDDSGPALESDSITPALRTQWITNWNLGALLSSLCTDACTTDFSLGFTALSTQYPNDRFALLSSLQDQTIRAFLFLNPMQFQAALLQMSADRLDPTTNFKYFFVTGQTHTMLGTPERFQSNGTSLWDWLRQEIDDDAAWSSTKP